MTGEMPGPFLRTVLAPFSALYGRALEARARLYRSGRFASYSAPCPVLSVGNLTFGGTGKTPFVELLARRLRFEGRRPAILSRGYGRRSKGLVVVADGSGPAVPAEKGGDEPVALARRLPGVPVVVAEKRVEAARAALDLGADLLVLDDGYQHLALRRDVDLLLLDARDPFGGGKLPPAGRLREPLSALARAHAFVFTRVNRAEPRAEVLAELARENPEAPVFAARIRPSGLSDEAGSPIDAGPLSKRRFVAVCGIASPSEFAASLTELDLATEEILAFPDHHRYRPRDLERILRAADRTGSSWIATTEKDAVKLAGKTSLPVVSVRLEAEVVGAGFFPFLFSRLAGEGARPPATASVPSA